MNTHSAASLFSLFQFADGLFPAGAYAHSFGLETCVQAGQVVDAAGVEAFLSAYLEGSAAPSDAAAASCAWKACRNEDLGSCLALDDILDAMKPVSELRAASRQMGRQTLRVAARLHSHHLSSGFFEAIEAGHTPGHHAVAFGIVGGVMGWPLNETVCAYLYSTSAALVSASLRLLRLGQVEGQRILGSLTPLLARLAGEACDKTPEEIWSFAPAHEIAAMQHASLDARLFRS